jgi:type I restriction enzyme S subunit
MLRSFPVPVAPPEEQRAIRALLDKELDRLGGQETATRTALWKAEAQRENVIAAAFRGELSDQFPNEESAIELLRRIQIHRVRQAAGPHDEAKLNRRVMMARPKKIDLAEVIEKMPADGFTFPELQKLVSIDYEELKTAVFRLLIEKPPRIKQVFDVPTQRMMLVRNKL